MVTMKNRKMKKRRRRRMKFHRNYYDWHASFIIGGYPSNVHYCSPFNINNKEMTMMMIQQ